MASARVLTANELGAARYQQALSADLWPVEVSLHRLPHDISTTAYTLHTPDSAAAVPLRLTPRNDLRATLRVGPGALLYEVRRDGALVATGGVDVRAPHPPLERALMAARLAERPPSGAIQLSLREKAAAEAEAARANALDGAAISEVTMATRSDGEDDDDEGGGGGDRRLDSREENNVIVRDDSPGNDENNIGRRDSNNNRNESGGASGGAEPVRKADEACWPVRFVYEEVTWMAREVDVVHADTGTLLAALKRDDGRFCGVAPVAAGTLRFRFRVRPHEGLSAHTAPFTRLGWDDAAMRHVWGLVTWPMEVEVVDLVRGGCGGDAVDGRAGAAVVVVDDAGEPVVTREKDVSDDDEREEEDDGEEYEEEEEEEYDDDDGDEGTGEETEERQTKKLETFDGTARAETPRTKAAAAGAKSGLRKKAKANATSHSMGVDRQSGVCGDSGHHGVGCFVVGMAMFLLGSSMTVLLGSRWNADERDDEWSESDLVVDGEAVLRHQRGVSF